MMSDARRICPRRIYPCRVLTIRSPWSFQIDVNVGFGLRTRQQVRLADVPSVNLDDETMARSRRCTIALIGLQGVDVLAEWPSTQSNHLVWPIHVYREVPEDDPSIRDFVVFIDDKPYCVVNWYVNERLLIEVDYQFDIDAVYRDFPKKEKD